MQNGCHGLKFCHNFACPISISFHTETITICDFEPFTRHQQAENSKSSNCCIGFRHFYLPCKMSAVTREMREMFKCKYLCSVTVFLRVAYQTIFLRSKNIHLCSAFSLNWRISCISQHGMLFSHGRSAFCTTNSHILVILLPTCFQT